MERLAKIGFTQSYTYFTWRNTKCGARRVLHRAGRGAESRLLPAELLGRTRPTSSTRSCSRRPPGVPAASCSPRRCRRATASTSGFELLRERAARSRQRGVPRLGEVRDAGTGTSNGPTACALIGRVQRDPPRAPGVPARSTTLALPRVDNEQPDRLRARSRQPTRSIVCVNLDPTRTRRGSRRSRSTLGLPASCVASSTSSPARATRGTAGVNYVLLPPGGAHVMRVE